MQHKPILVVSIAARQFRLAAWFRQSHSVPKTPEWLYDLADTTSRIRIGTEVCQVFGRRLLSEKNAALRGQRGKTLFQTGFHVMEASRGSDEVSIAYLCRLSSEVFLVVRYTGAFVTTAWRKVLNENEQFLMIDPAARRKVSSRLAGACPQLRATAQGLVEE